MPSFYVTPIGLSAIRARLEAARAAFKSVCDDNPAARESGDSSVWHDNFAFEENQRLMHQLAARIRDLETELANAIVVSLPELVPTQVVIGARVLYAVDGERQPRTCTLVGHGEGRPELRCIAYDSPLGAALLGARMGDEVELVIGGRACLGTIVAIALADPALLSERSMVAGPTPSSGLASEVVR
jgi:transcription elongation factor GreA